MNKSMMLLLVVLCCACLAQTIRSNIYYPIEVGNKYTCIFTVHATDSSDTRYYETVDTFFMGGYKTYLTEAMRASDSLFDTLLTQIDSLGVYSLVNFYRRYDYFLMMPRQFNIGDTWIISNIETTYDIGGGYRCIERHSDYVFETSIVESVLLDMGTFYNCLKIESASYQTITIMFHSDTSSDTLIKHPPGYSICAPNVGNILSFSIDRGETVYTSVVIDYKIAGIIESEKPQVCELEILAYPNPFNSSCRIDVNRSSEIEILDTKGRVIYRSKDAHFIWKPDRNIRSGIYFVRASNGEVSITKRILYLK